jgi:hypothetical protein
VSIYILVSMMLSFAILTSPGVQQAFAESETSAAAEVRSGPTVTADAAKKESPWVILPLVQSNPKLGTALGAMGAYLHRFDDKSRLSMFGAGGIYTSTDSAVLMLFAKTSFDEDRQRLVIANPNGRINNDYKDYLGTGVEVHTQDDLHALMFRYLYRVYDNWFVGLQGVRANYNIDGETQVDDEFLTAQGLVGFKTGALGLSFYHDSRDNDNSPTRGWVLQMGNMAHRDWMAGDLDYDTYMVNYRGYTSHGDGNVFAARWFNMFTDDAPISGSAKIVQRGYKLGQYLGQNMSMIEVEERYKLAGTWTATLFGGYGCLYGGGKSCSDGENRFPNWGGGIQYVLKPKEGIVANLEYAAGKWDNWGLILKMGYAF